MQTEITSKEIDKMERSGFWNELQDCINKRNAQGWNRDANEHDIAVMKTREFTARRSAYVWLYVFRNWTQQAIADHFKVSKRTVWNAINSNHVPIDIEKIY